MQFATHRYAEALVAHPAGRIDHTNATGFEGALAPLLSEAAADGGALVLDFSAVDYISSVGLRVLMIAAKQMRDRRATLVVAAAQPVVAEIFAISRFDKVLTLTTSVEGALAHGSEAARAAWA